MQEDKTPEVSVIMPVYNEERYIRQAVQYIAEQDWPGSIQIIIVDGGSSDQTLAIIEELRMELPSHRTLDVLHNPARYIPVSLNMACRYATSDVIVRTDAHTYVPHNYVSLTVQSLKAIDFQGIAGGRIEILPGADSAMAKAISLSVCHPLGVGNALYRTWQGADDALLEVDTVPFGAFTKELWQALGGYDEKLLFDEDYDFNYRAKKAGYRIVLNPAIVLQYFSRKTLLMLGQQYYRYGYWANQFIKKHRVIPSLRRFIPAFFLLTLGVTGVAELLWGLRLFWMVCGIYLLAILGVSLREGLLRRKSLVLALNLIPTFPTLHVSYGLGSIVSLLFGGKQAS